MHIKGIHKSISHTAGQFIPLGVRDSAYDLERLLIAYYEWAELDGEFIAESKKMLDSFSYVTAGDEWLQTFKEVYLRLFPDMDEDKLRALLKFSRTFYAERGTPESFKFIFKMLWDAHVEIEFPAEFIMRSSDGVWVNSSNMKINTATLAPDIDLKNALIIGRSSGARAFITLVTPTKVDNIVKTELQNLTYDFIPNEIIDIYSDINAEDYVGLARTVGVLGGYEIINPGRGFLAGRDVHINTSKEGQTIKVAIKGVNAIDGSITALDIIEAGEGYMYDIPDLMWDDPYLYDVRLEIREEPEIKFLYTANFEGSGEYLTKKSLLSDLWKLRDGHHYHEFAYIIKTSLEKSIYTKAVKELLHPAGLAVAFERVYPSSETTYVDLQESAFGVESERVFKTDGLTRYSNYSYYNDITSIYTGSSPLGAGNVDDSRFEQRPIIFESTSDAAETVFDELIKIKNDFESGVASNTYTDDWYEKVVIPRGTERPIIITNMRPAP